MPNTRLGYRIYDLLGQLVHHFDDSLLAVVNIRSGDCDLGAAATIAYRQKDGQRYNIAKVRIDDGHLHIDELAWNLIQQDVYDHPRINRTRRSSTLRRRAAPDLTRP